MKLTKKIALGAVTLFSAAALAACSNSEDIVTMEGGSITVDEFYETVKTNSSAQQVLLEMVISEVFEEAYGDKVSDSDVDDAYNETAEQYGDSFESALSSAGLTTETYKAQIRTNKLVEYAVSEAAKDELTDENFEAAFEAYTPEVTAQIIKVSDEETAETVLAAAQQSDADWATLVSENATLSDADETGTITFDSTSTVVPTDVQTAIFALDEGQVASSVVSVIDYTTYTASYYVVKLVSATEKSDNWEDYKDILKEAILTEKENDSTFITSVISEELTKANVKVKDEAFQSLISQYVTTSSSTSTTSEEETTEESSEESTDASSEESTDASSEESTDDSSTEESSSEE